MTNCAFDPEHVTINRECPRTGILASAIVHLAPDHRAYRYLVIETEYEPIAVFPFSEGAKYCDRAFPETSQAIKRAVRVAFLDHGGEPSVAPVPQPKQPPTLHARAA